MVVERYLLGKVVIYVRRRPRYNDGWKFCSKCNLAFKPSVPMPFFNRCPFCGAALRYGSRKKKWNDDMVVKVDDVEEI